MAYVSLSSSCGVAIRYVLPVLWVTSYLLICSYWSGVGNGNRANAQSDSPGTAPGGTKSDLYDYLVLNDAMDLIVVRERNGTDRAIRLSAVFANC